MNKLTIPQRLSLAINMIRKGSLDDLFPNRGEHLGSFRAGASPSIPSGYSYMSAINDYESYVWLFKAVKYIADAIAPLPLEVWRDKKPLDKHPLLDLYSRVNDTMTHADIWRQWTVDMLLAGESAQELVKSKGNAYVEIWPRQPHTVNIKTAAGGARYYRIDSYVIDDGKGEPYGVPIDEMLFFKFYNPKNPWRGLAPISAARMSIAIDKLAQSWSADFYLNGARPDYAIVAPQGTTPSEQRQLKQQVKEQHRGRSSEPIVLEDGIVDIKTLSFPPKDMTWLEHRNMSRDEVAAIFGLPDIIMGFGADSYDTEDKRRVAERAAWTMTIKPLVDFRDNRLTEYWRRVGMLGANEEVKTDLDDVAVLRADLDSKLGQMERLWAKGVPFNKLITALELGIEPIEGGDIGYLPSGFMPINEIGYSVVDALPADQPALQPAQDQPPAQLPPQAEADQTIDGPSADDMPMPAPQAAPAKHFRGLIRRELSATSEVKSSVPLLVKAGAMVEYGSELHKALDAEFMKRASKRQRAFGQAIGGLMERQKAEVMGRLSGAKAVKSAEDVAKNPFDKRKWKREFIKTSAPLYERIVDDAGNAALNDVSAEVDFNLLDPHVVRFIEQRSQRFAQRVNDTTWDTLKASLAQGIKDGESIDSLAERVTNVMDGRIRSSAETIARTETIGASNGGMLEGWRQSDIVKHKQWLATLSDDRTRDTHVEAHGQEVALDDDFEVGDGSGPAPGQIGLAEEDVNCRCTLLAVVD